MRKELIECNREEVFSKVGVSLFRASISLFRPCLKEAFLWVQINAATFFTVAALRGVQPSISSTFYACVFETKFWRQKLQWCVLGLKFFGTKILAKKLCVKCWWNWHHLSGSVIGKGMLLWTICTPPPKWTSSVCSIVTFIGSSKCITNWIT